MKNKIEEYRAAWHESKKKIAEAREIEDEAYTLYKEEVNRVRLSKITEVDPIQLKGDEVFIIRDHFYYHKLKGIKAMELFDSGACFKILKNGCTSLKYSDVFLVLDASILDSIEDYEYIADDKRTIGM